MSTTTLIAFYLIAFLFIFDKNLLSVNAYPVPNEEDDGQEQPGGGVIETPPPSTNWQNAWTSAKSYFGKIQSYLGQTDQATWIDLIGKGATFVTALRENPQQLIDAAKDALAKAIANQLVPANSQAARDLQTESNQVQQKLQQAAESVQEEGIQQRVLRRED